MNTENNNIQFKNKLFVLLFTYIISISIFSFNLFIRKDLETNYFELFNILGFSFFFFNLSLVKDLFKREKQIFEFYYLIPLVFLGIIILSFLPLFINNILFYIISFIGYISTLYILYLIFKNLEIIQIFILSLIALLFSGWVIGYLYNQEESYSTPLFLESLALGKGNVDLWFHLAIAQMIKTYNIPSTGLDGIPYLSYHYGSHYLFVQLSNFTNLTLEKIYNFIYPILFIPLYFNILFNSVLKLFDYKQNIISLNPVIKEGFIFWFIFILMNLGICTPDQLLVYNYPLEIGSQSYNLGLFFMFFVLCVFLDYLKNKKLYTKIIIALFVGIGFFIKISIGFLLVSALGYYLIRTKKILQIKTLLLGLTCLSIYFIIYKLTGEYNKTTFSLFHFIKNYTDINIWYYFIPLYLIGLIVYSILRIYQVEKKENTKNLIELFKTNKLIDIETLVIISFSSLLPGILLSIGGGSAAFFSDVPKILIIILLLGFTPFILNIIQKYNNLISIKTLSLIIFFPIILFWLIYSKGVFYMALNSQLSLHNDFIHQIQTSSMTQKRYEFFTKLSKLDNLPIKEKRKLLIHIPYQNTNTYTNLYNYSDPQAKLHHNKFDYHFISPAITGIASINGFPSDDILKGYKYYGFYAYSKPKRNIPLSDDNSLIELKKRVELLGLKNKRILKLEYKKK